MTGLTIDKFDIGIYIQYARRTQLVEQVRQQYHLREAESVPAQALIVDLYPKLTELDILLGISSLALPWAYFYAPRNFSMQRRSTFAFHRLLLGKQDQNKQNQQQKQEEEKSDEQVLEEVECQSTEETHEKNVLKACFKQIEELNALLRYIGGRIGQFLQG
jgi:hypothetical protein